MKVLLPPDETTRLSALRHYGILDTPAEPEFDEIMQLAAQLCAAPVALISFIDADRLWFKARIGLNIPQTSREYSFCEHAILQQDVFVVPDASADERFAANPLVAGEPYLRFYGAAPLVTADGHALGTLCILDHQTRVLSLAQEDVLRALSRQVMAQLELRRRQHEQETLACELEAAKEQLSRRDILWQTAMQQIGDAVLTLDAAGCILWTNPAASSLFGASVERLNGRSLGAFLFEEPDGLHNVLEWAKTASAIPRRMWLQRADGSRLLCDCTVTQVDGEQPLRWLVVVRNVAQAQRQEQVKSDFVGAIAHELRTPLTSVHGALSLLRGLPDPCQGGQSACESTADGARATSSPFSEAQAQTLLDIACTNTGRMVRLINDILDLSRLESGCPRFDIQSLEIKDVLHEAAQAQQVPAGQAGLAIEVETSAPQAQVLADRERLMQVMGNLLSNAIKFSPNGDVVRVRAVPSPRDQHIRITVEDHGPGISDELCSQLWNAFTLTDAVGTRKNSGGLSLSLCKAIIERMNGRIDFSTRTVPNGLPTGTTFFFDLPASLAAPLSRTI